MSSPSIPPSTVTFRSFNVDRTFKLSTTYESAAGLEHMGFTTSAAQEIFNHYQTRYVLILNSLLPCLIIEKLWQ
jgi:hypothetical protein